VIDVSDRAQDDEDIVDPAVAEALLDQPFALGEHLRAEVSAELDRREGEWSAFEACVMRRIDLVGVEEERMSLEERAIQALHEDIDAELADLAPDFERSFREGIERRIWRSAKRPSIVDRLEAWMESWRVRLGWRNIGLVTATALILLAFMFGGHPLLNAPGVAMTDAVSIDDVSFEGTVTVMPEDGITVLWLADTTS
jgi:hypothetical protein